MANETAQPQTAQSTPQQPSPAPQNKGYGKRPMWQWLVIYAIIGAIVYAAVWYFFLRGGGVPGY